MHPLNRRLQQTNTAALVILFIDEGERRFCRTKTWLKLIVMSLPSLY
jgi:hypothetical protein